jgi:hypothetical protein
MLITSRATESLGYFQLKKYLNVNMQVFASKGKLLFTLSYTQKAFPDCSAAIL